MIIIQRLW